MSLSSNKIMKNNIDTKIDEIISGFYSPDTMKASVKQLIKEVCEEVIGEDESELEKDDWTGKLRPIDPPRMLLRVFDINQLKAQQRQKLKEVLDI